MKDIGKKATQRRKRHSLINKDDITQQNV